MSSKKKKKPTTLDLIKATRSRDWVVNPVTKVVPDKKKKASKMACRRVEKFG